MGTNPPQDHGILSRSSLRAYFVYRMAVSAFISKGKLRPKDKK